MTEQIRFPESWSMPEKPGYGTFPAPFARSGLSYASCARAAQPAIEAALASGCRHIDTAFAYRNQDLVGAAINARGISRDEVFVTSKLHVNNNSYDEARVKVREAIEAIWGSSVPGHYLDAFLIHYPGAKEPVMAWKALLEVRQQGLIKHAGVSNFEDWHLQKLHQATGQYPELNQIELHPYNYSEQKQLLEFCRANGIVVEAYSPLAEGEVLADSALRRIAEAKRTTPARVALKWCMQHGVRPIVGSRNPEHIKANVAPYDFSLGADEMETINSLSSRQVTRVSLKWNWNPKTAPLGHRSWRSRLRSLLGVAGAS